MSQKQPQDMPAGPRPAPPPAPPKPLRLFNGRGWERGTYAYIAAYSVADAARLMSQAARITESQAQYELKHYWNEGQWGIPMANVVPRRGLWIISETVRNARPIQLLGEPDAPVLRALLDIPDKSSNREPCYLTRGEQALVQRALRVYVHDEQIMIQQAHAKYKKRDPKIFADHKQHHDKAIKAADDLFERFRTGTVKEDK